MKRILIRSTRSLSSTVTPTPTPLPDQPQGVDAIPDELLDQPTKQNGNGYRAWLTGEGARYRKPVPGGTNYLAETVRPPSPPPSH